MHACGFPPAVVMDDAFERGTTKHNTIKKTILLITRGNLITKRKSLFDLCNHLKQCNIGLQHNAAQREEKRIIATENSIVYTPIPQDHEDL